MYQALFQVLGVQLHKIILDFVVVGVTQKVSLYVSGEKCYGEKQRRIIQVHSLLLRILLTRCSSVLGI